MKIHTDDLRGWIFQKKKEYAEINQGKLNKDIVNSALDILDKLETFIRQQERAAGVKIEYRELRKF